MKRPLIHLWGPICWFATGLALFAQTGETALITSAAQLELPAARELLDNLLNRLPDQPVTLQGVLKSDKNSDGIATRFKIDMHILARGPAAHGTYRLADNFGSPLAHLEIRRPPGLPPSLLLETGAPPHTVQSPSLNLCLPDSDLLWMDLTLGFLWWTEGKTIGIQEVKGQSCYLVDLYSPNPAQDRYASVRLWIDRTHGMLLLAEAQDPLGHIIRRVSIKSFRKIGDAWMIKDLEIRTLPDNRKTILTIDSMTGADLPEPDGAEIEAEPDSPLR
jgi:hypothetical protein